MKRGLILFFVFVFLFSFSFIASADDNKHRLLSIVKLPLELSKFVECDRISASFKIYAQGDNYNMALKRLQKINNDFLVFLKKRFDKNEIKTGAIGGYSNNATVYVSVDTDKIKKIQGVLSYILNKKFEYKTGIKPLNLRPYISNKLRYKVENNLYVEALNIAKQKLKRLNIVFGGGYFMKNMNMSYNGFVLDYAAKNTASGVYLSKSMPRYKKQGLEISSGRKTVRLNAKLEFAKILK